jgi:hypothetical protein
MKLYVEDILALRPCYPEAVIEVFRDIETLTLKNFESSVSAYSKVLKRAEMYRAEHYRDIVQMDFMWLAISLLNHTNRVKYVFTIAGFAPRLTNLGYICAKVRCDYATLMELLELQYGKDRK